MRTRFLPLFLGLFILLGLNNHVSAQGVTSGAFSGVVVDGDGTPLAGATVVAIHTPTGTKYGAITREEGRFNLPNARVGGPYTISASYVGYEADTRERVYLSLGQNYRISFTLVEAGVTMDEVTITSTTGIMSSERTGAETRIGLDQINSLPTVSRSIGDFARLTPQATVREGGDGFSISLNGMNNRYNAIYIDGAINNDVFGLAGSGTNGGQTGVSPIAIDAVEEFQVALAPFDVRVGGFAGGAINAVTRSGSNNLEASVYGFYRNQALAGLTPTDNESVDRTRLADFTALTSGFRVGGALIKDKLFFFVNAEIQRDETPQPFDIANYDGDASAADLAALATKLNGLGYDPGTYDNSRSTLSSDKVTVKLDWNLNANNRLSIRHGYVGARNLEGVVSSSRRINFLNASEYFVSSTNSTALELNSTISSTLSNNLKVGVTIVRDDRDPFQGDEIRAEDNNPNYSPFVIIQDGSGEIRFGSEQFSTANALNQNIITLTDNLTLYTGDHAITFGTHNEFFDVYNLFIRQNYGVYEYSSLAQFMNDDPANEFYRSYSLTDDVTGDGSAAASEFSGAQFGVYVQDEWQVTPSLTLTPGIRFDVPVYFNSPAQNDDFNTRTIPLLEAQGYDLMGAQTGEFINPQVLVSPRLGFRLDVNGDQSTIIRGGAGIFTSRIPLVWPGGAFNNNGVTVGGDFATGPRDTWFRPWNGLYNPQWDNQPQAVEAGAGQPSGQIDLFADDFKVPQVAKFNLAVDQKLPWDMVLNVDFIYNKTLNNVTYQNLNLRPSTTKLTGTGDDRLLFNRRDEVDDTYSRIMLASNTNEGYSWNGSVTLTKPFQNGFSGTVAYSFGDAFTVFDGTSSQNSSQWRNFPTVNGKNFDQALGRSSFSQGHRAIAGLSYKVDWNANKNASTTFTIFYEGISGTPFSMVYNDRGNLTGEDSREYALLYVPVDANDIILIDDASHGTAAEQWAALDAFISAHPQLDENRGDYVGRNTFRTPFSNVIDAKLVQDLSLYAGGKEHRLQLTFDVFNLTNLINANWGRRYFTGAFGAFQLLDFEGFQTDGTTPEFTFPGVEETFPGDNIDDFGIQSSRWQMQIGVRYLFQ